MTGHGHESVESISVQPPDIKRLDSKDFSISYDELADTMFVYFVGGEVQPVSVLVDPDNDVYALVDAASHEVIGVQLEAFLAKIVHQWPEFLTLAIWSGIPSDRLDSVIQGITGQGTSREEHRNIQRRVFDLSVREQIERLFHLPDDRGVASAV